ncbi:hypothetical protein CHELA20_52773 [Hyphomicrobiales bacterium]|nr:hypothetical protein CHELA41_22152 [Hyphomicrobiales bacterium]CAH1682878.1 hypothetical protein CHELA20_52773 [Hyphomicrobiales bacterium]
MPQPRRTARPDRTHSRHSRRQTGDRSPTSPPRRPGTPNKARRHGRAQHSRWRTTPPYHSRRFGPWTPPCSHSIVSHAPRRILHLPPTPAICNLTTALALTIPESLLILEHEVEA